MYRKFKAHLFNEFLYSGCEQLLETFSLFWIFWCPFLQPVQRQTIIDLASHKHNTTKLKTQSYQPDLKSTSFSTQEFWTSSMLASSPSPLPDIHLFLFSDWSIIVVKAGSEVFVLPNWVTITIFQSSLKTWVVLYIVKLKTVNHIDQSPNPTVMNP